MNSRSMEDAAEDGIRTRMILNSEIPVTGIPMTTGMTAEMTDMIAETIGMIAEVTGMTAEVTGMIPGEAAGTESGECHGRSAGNMRNSLRSRSSRAADGKRSTVFGISSLRCWCSCFW